MTAQQSALTRLLDWAAGQVATIRSSHVNRHTWQIDDEEIREEVKQVEADIATLSGEGMAITIQKAPRCFWHSDCDEGLIKNNGIMRIAHRDDEKKRDLFECLKCGRKGYVPHGTQFDVPICVDVVHEPAVSDEGSVRECWVNRDTRPQRGGWAPGTYYCVCKIGCGRHFIGDKRAVTCADCAYADDFGNLAATPPQRRDALEALRQLEELAIADSHNRSPYDIGRDAGTVRRDLQRGYECCREATEWHLLVNDIERAAGFDSVAVTPDATPIVERVDEMRRALSEPAVPEAVVRIAREALSCCGCSPAERDSGHKIGCPVPQLQDELDRALAQHGERVPNVETIRDVICLLEQSAGPFDEACRLLRATLPETRGGNDDD